MCVTGRVRMSRYLASASRSVRPCSSTTGQHGAHALVAWRSESIVVIWLLVWPCSSHSGQLGAGACSPGDGGDVAAVFLAGKQPL